MGSPSSIVLVSEHYGKETDDYQKQLLALGYKTGSVRTHRRHLYEFFSWCEQKNILRLRHISAEHINKYYIRLQKRPNKRNGGVLSMRTKDYHMRSIQLFFAAALEQGKIKTNPASTLILPKLPPYEERTVLTVAEIKLLYACCRTHTERAVLSLAYGCGMRAGEISAVNIEDVKTRDRLLIVPKGKMNKRRVIPMSGSIAEDLEQYLHHERSKQSRHEKAFILHGRGGRIRPYTLNKILKRIITETNNEALRQKEPGIHHLRHSIATHLLERGVPVEQVRQFLGHAHLESTQIYTRVSKEQLKSVIREQL